MYDIFKIYKYCILNIEYDLNFCYKCHQKLKLKKTSLGKVTTIYYLP